MPGGPDPDPDALAEGVLAGDRRALAKAITLVESTREDHRAAAEQLLALIPAVEPPAMRIGISGAPGVGKSTLVEALGQHIIGRGDRVAVLAVDPSSARSGGSILGDKTRMITLARCDDAFIRPSPAGRTLGGVARRTREAIHLCEASGFRRILVETVGVGQSETSVAGMTDLFTLVVAPAGGDELQGIKRGIMELADLVVVNKADGELLPRARQAVAEYRSAIGLLTPRHPGMPAEAHSVSALTGDGVPELWDELVTRWNALGARGDLAAQRADQARQWLWEEVDAGLRARALRAAGLGMAELEADVIAGRVLPHIAAATIVGRLVGEAP
jgi:LAO/AO transport system kinase